MLSGGSHLIVRGYHGTTKDIAEELASQTTPFRVSNDDGDWLGRGAYFFQDGPQRALAWARRHKSSADAAVLVAEIDITNRIDFFDIDAWVQMRALLPDFEAYESISGEEATQGGLKVQGGSARMRVSSGDASVGIRGNRRDRAFINWCAELLEGAGARVDAVRAPFLFGEAVYPSSFLFDESHVQIAVRNPDKITPISII